MTARKEYPPLGELADENDTLAWDRERHGRMADHARPDNTVPVERIVSEFQENAPHGLKHRETRYGGVDESPETD